MSNFETSHQFTGSWLMQQPKAYGPDARGYYQENPNPVFEKTFTLPQISQARLYLTALGYRRVTINGKEINQDVLVGDVTSYAKRLYYTCDDVTDLLKVGANTIQVELGNGIYNPSPLKMFGKYNLRERFERIGEPRFSLDLEMNQQILVTSDNSWQVHQGALTFNNLYLGEHWDFTRHAQVENVLTQSWTPEEQKSLRVTKIPPIRRFEPITAIAIQETKAGWILDFGRTTSGFLKGTITATEDQQAVSIRYSEAKTSEGRLAFETSFAGNIGWIPPTGGPGAPEKAYQEDRFTCQKGPNPFENRFTYHSFRYVLVKGCQKSDLNTFQAIPVHTDLTQVGQVTTDDPWLNQLYQAGIATKLNNVHGIFEDCARERFEYGGDLVALADSQLYLFDLREMLPKVLDDFALTQTSAGGIAETAPYMGIQTHGTGAGEGPILWQLCLPYLLTKDYQYYGDETVLEKYYPAVKRQAAYLLKLPLETVVDQCIGDHGSILVQSFRDETPDKRFVGYCTLLQFAQLTAQLAELMNQVEDQHHFQEQARRLRAIIQKQYVASDGAVMVQHQTGMVFAARLSIGDRAKVVQQLVTQIDDDHSVFTGGIFGMAAAYRVLHDAKRDDLVLAWLEKKTAPSFKTMLANGNGVLQELFAGDYYSANHAMFSSYTQWYTEALGGIQISDTAVGANEITLNPYFAPSVSHCEASLTTSFGKIKTQWQRRQSEVIYRAQVPKPISVTLASTLNPTQVQTHADLVEYEFHLSTSSQNN